MTNTVKDPYADAVQTAEITAFLLQMVACFAENADDSQWKNCRFALTEIMSDHSRRLKGQQEDISDLEGQVLSLVTA